MGKKGGSSQPQPTAPTITAPSSSTGKRAPSPAELRLLGVQADAIQSGMHVAEQQEARSEQLHDIWSETYLPVETGMIHGDASQENGYMDSKSINHAMNKENYKVVSCSRCNGSGHAGSGTCGKCNGAGAVEKSPSGYEKPISAPQAAQAGAAAASQAAAAAAQGKGGVSGNANPFAGQTRQSQRSNTNSAGANTKGNDPAGTVRGFTGNRGGIANQGRVR